MVKEPLNFLGLTVGFLNMGLAVRVCKESLRVWGSLAWGTRVLGLKAWVSCEETWKDEEYKSLVTSTWSS